MAETPTAASVYAEQLICKGHGLPLWQPEPTKFGEVLIGDVGFVQSGQFFRLFNATQSADDPVNRDGVPEGFVPLQYNERTLEHTQPNYLRPGAVYNGQSTSCSVQAGIGLGAANLNVGGKYNFACNADRAAIAMLGGPGHHSQVLDNAFFRDYIARYHESWYAFAVSRGLLVPAEDIILVYGWVKTSHWALAVCSSNAASHDISFEVPAVGTFASASFGVSVSNNSFNAVEQRSGPDNSWDTGPSLPGPAANDQCLFLRYYKLKSRWLRSPVVVTKVEAKDAHGAASGTRPRGSSTSSSRSTESRKQDGSFTRALKNFTQKWSTSLTNRRNPESLAPTREGVLQRMGNVEQFPAIEPAGGHDKQLNDVLDYILANSEAHSAVVCHDDLYAMFPAPEQWPSDVKGCLTGWKPSILVNDTQAGWLSPAAQVYQQPTPIDAIPSRLRSNRGQRHSASFTPTTHDSLSPASGTAQERTSSLETSTTLAGSATPASTLIESFTQGLGLVGTPIDYELDAPSNATKEHIVTLQIHPLLSCTNTHHAPIKYDVALAPSEQTVLDRSASSPIPSHLLTQPATDPPSCERLVLRSAKLPWSIVVTPSKKSSPLQSYVPTETPITVADVLDTIHLNMMTTVTPEEMESLGRSTNAQHKVLKAYETRCLRRLGGVREGGVKRIDWLGDETELVGVEMDTGTEHGNVARIFFAEP